MYQRIIVPVDGSAISASGLDVAIGLARLSGATLRLVHVIEIANFVTGFEPYEAYADDALPMIEKAAAAILEQARRHAAAGAVTVQTCMFKSLGERVAERVIEQAESWHADLIVIGTHGRRGVERLMLGSDAEQIVRLSPIPVLLVRAPQAGAEVRTEGQGRAHGETPQPRRDIALGSTS